MANKSKTHKNGKTHPARPEMTAEDAKTFDQFSVFNAATLADAAAERGCVCQAYTDWFTYKRWLAQGFQVQRGEHGIKLPVYLRREVEDEKSGKVREYTIPMTTTVFCRHQVAERQ